jgi:hypothetical protein
MRVSRGWMITLSNENSKKEHSHTEIVRKILPRFADRLRREGVIESYDRKPFTIKIWDFPPVRIIPDLILHLHDKAKVLIEIVNPKDPKRFMGEIAYPHLLKYHKGIKATIFFVLRYHQRKHDRGLGESLALSFVFKTSMPNVAISWPKRGHEENAYKNLKGFLTITLPQFHEGPKDPEIDKILEIFKKKGEG